MRSSMAQELRKLLEGQIPDQAKVLSLGRRYGELDGGMSWYYATAFAKVDQALTRTQRAALMALRHLEGYPCAPYYLYSHPVQDPPVLDRVDAFFFAPLRTGP